VQLRTGATRHAAADRFDLHARGLKAPLDLLVANLQHILALQAATC